MLKKAREEAKTADKENAGGKKLKRSFDIANLLNDDHDDDDASSGYEDFPVTENCDQIRRKINTFMNNGDMKVKDFVEVIGVTGVGYYRFMNQRGKDKGAGSDTYIRASNFFKQREARGIPMPKKRKLTEPLSDMSTNAKGVKGNKSITVSALASISIAHIELSGEKEDAVEVYDSCDEIRRKISAHLRKPNVTQTAFLRELHAQFHGPRKPKSLQAAQLNTFRGYKGPTTGNMSGIYYAAYVYFEKERIAAGRSKSQHRLDMEDAWGGRGGMDLSRNLNNVAYICSVNSRPRMDSLGRIQVYHG
jgi:hypothetical protein